MTKDSAGFFARLFGKRSPVLQANDAATEGTTAPVPEAGQQQAPSPQSVAQRSDSISSETAGPETTDSAVPDVQGAADAPATEAMDLSVPATDHPDEAINPESEAQDAETSESEAADTQAADVETPVSKIGDAPVAEGKIITIVSVVPHAGLATLGAALTHRFEDQDVQIRTAGPGLMRAAFAGLLSGSDALVLVAPADPEATAEFAEKLSWLEANGRTALAGRSIFVVNYGAVKDSQPLVLPADLPRPVVMLPFDNALSLPSTSPRAPRRAARHALSQIVDELNLILEAT